MATTTMGSHNNTPASRKTLGWVFAGLVILAFIIFYTMKNNNAPSSGYQNRAATGATPNTAPGTNGAPSPAGNNSSNNNGQ
jgi:hypothetical protein